jgi:hypothetical protein
MPYAWVNGVRTNLAPREFIQYIKDRAAAARAKKSTVAAKPASAGGSAPAPRASLGPSGIATGPSPFPVGNAPPPFITALKTETPVVVGTPASVTPPPIEVVGWTPEGEPITRVNQQPGQSISYDWVKGAPVTEQVQTGTRKVLKGDWVDEPVYGTQTYVPWTANVTVLGQGVQPGFKPIAQKTSLVYDLYPFKDFYPNAEGVVVADKKYGGSPFEGDAVLKVVRGSPEYNALMQKGYTDVSSPTGRAGRFLLESYTEIGGSLAFGSIFKQIIPAANTAKGFLRVVNKGTQAVGAGSVFVGAGAMGYETAVSQKSGEISRLDVGARFFSLGANVAAAGYGMAGRGYGNAGIIKNQFTPMGQKRNLDVTYFKDTGTINIRKIHNILGYEFRGLSRTGTMKKGLDFYDYTPPKDIIINPPGLAQGPTWNPSALTSDIIMVRQGKTIFASPSKYAWSARSGIDYPYIKTGKELSININPKPIKIPIRSIIEYDPGIAHNNPLVDDIKNTLDYIDWRWQPKTGISWPNETPGIDVKKQIPINMEHPLNIPFKTPKTPMRIIKLSVDMSGNILGTKYGITQRTGGVYSKEGKYWYTGRELSTNVYPKPVLYKFPGKMTIYEHPLNLFGFLESGKTLDTETLFSIKPKYKPRLYRIGDIIKQVEMKGIVSDGSQGQKTITVLEKPTVQESIVINKPLLRRKTIMDMYTESEVLSIEKSTSDYQKEYLSTNKYRQIQKSKSESVIGYLPVMGTRSILAFDSKKIKDSASASMMMLNFKNINIQESIRASKYDKGQTYDSINIYSTYQGFRNNFSFDSSSIIDKYPFKQKEEKIIEIKVPGFPTSESIGDGKDRNVQGYRVFVKDRSYVHGRKALPERWKQLPYVLSRKDALSLGGSAVDGSAAASFKIREDDGRARRLPFSVSDWGAISGKFYNKNGVYIESTGNRIDSSGEIAGISALGWLASRRREAMPVRTSRAVPRVMMPRRPVSVASLRLPDVDKMLRGFM